MDLSPDLLLAIGAIITAGVAVINSFSTSRKNRGDAAAAISQGYGTLVNDYQEQVRELKEQVKGLTVANTALREQVKGLTVANTALRERVMGLELKFSQALERISVLEGENELLRGA